MSDAPFIPLAFERLSEAEMRERAHDFHSVANRRRSVRAFSPDPVPIDVLETCILSAGTAPSGAHKQPWTFALVTDPAIKSRIREAAEEEERENYARRMNAEWLDDLRPFNTNAEKPFLEIAPALIILFRHAWEIDEDGERGQNYYTQESVGIAAGMLLAALNDAGLATLTHTPSPMGFLAKALGRPENEKAFLLIPVGYPADGCEVPDLERKPLGKICVRY
ncbi:Coenzyme F420:L-glutamate ligase [Planctomycetes bacterium Poly30]|uniref:Coenzyme F420:L-glutamate ligase n=1 Tax=Saltatorellus ferox TaxID=2528018 RepID=A0A518EV35_9BACT|nr:Coenzyme F420:L-glutamate ligase [Planctomycetes bacterium Poly30]